MVESRLIYAVYEENHGIIAVADQIISATEMLITSGWVTISDDVWCCREKKYIPISDVMERLGYIDNEAFSDFIADMFTDRIKGYEWGFHLRTISFYEEV